MLDGGESDEPHPMSTSAVRENIQNSTCHQMCIWFMLCCAFLPIFCNFHLMGTRVIIQLPSLSVRRPWKIWVNISQFQKEVLVFHYRTNILIWCVYCGIYCLWIKTNCQHEAWNIEGWCKRQVSPEHIHICIYQLWLSDTKWWLNTCCLLAPSQLPEPLLPYRQ